MEYRKLPHGEEQISVIGMGSSVIGEKTDYIDFGFIHCIDEEADLITYEKNGILNFLMDSKAQGIVKHIGLSTHAPELANKVLDRNILDMPDWISD